MSSPLRVLNAEDSEADAILLRRHLINAGYDVELLRVEDEQTMAAALREREWDVVIADYNIPGFGALEALRVVRESGLDLPLIVLSGDVGEDLAVAAMRAGVNDYLMKGHMARLAPAIDRELAEAANRRARRQAETELNASNERYRSLVDSLPLIVWETDTAGRLRFVNRPWPESVDMPNSKAPGGWWSHTHPDDTQAVVDAYLAARAARQPIHVQFRMRDDAGSYRWQDLSGEPRYTPDGEFAGYIGFSMDVTERKSLEAQLIESQKLESLGRLAGGVAHDFNNLLTVIAGYVELALLSLPADTQEAGYLRVVGTAVERSAGLTSQLLMYARRQMVDFTAVNLNDVVLRMDGLLRRTIGEDCELVMSLSEDLRTVRTNASQMEQVVLNLVVNARDSMPHGGTIVVETANMTVDDDHAARHIEMPPGDYVCIAVTDQGTGMPPEVKARVFEPFYTTKPVGKGTGLGLATCYGIVKQSKGNITVYSEVGIGTTFKVYIPAASDPVAAPVAGPVRPMERPTGTVLLVDDEPMVRDFAARVLREEGYAVVEAANGSDASRRYEQCEGIDLLITDVVMPLMGGLELADRLKTLQPDLKVLFISGYAEGALANSQGANEVASGLLTKPFSRNALLEAVAQSLTHKPVAKLT